METILEKYEHAGYLASKPGVVSMSFRDKKVYLTITGNEAPRVTITFSGNRVFISKELNKSLLIWSKHDISETVMTAALTASKNSTGNGAIPMCVWT